MMHYPIISKMLIFLLCCVVSIGGLQAEETKQPPPTQKTTIQKPTETTPPSPQPSVTGSNPVNERQAFPPTTSEIQAPPPPQKEEFDPQLSQFPKGSLEEREWILQQLIVPIPLILAESKDKVYPAMAQSIPLAYGQQWGDIGVGFSYQSFSGVAPKPDAAASLGFGLGSASKQVGLDIRITTDSITEDTFSSGLVSAKVHRHIAQGMAVALGVEKALSWGGTDQIQSYYGVVTMFLPLKDNVGDRFSIMGLSLGLGTGRFRFRNDSGKFTGKINIFGGASILMSRTLSGFIEWMGQDLAMGVSLTPFEGIPMIVTIGMEELLGTANFTAGAPVTGPRFVASIGFGFSLLKDLRI